MTHLSAPLQTPHFLSPRIGLIFFNIPDIAYVYQSLGGPPLPDSNDKRSSVAFQALLRALNEDRFILVEISISKRQLENDQSISES